MVTRRLWFRSGCASPYRNKAKLTLRRAPGGEARFLVQWLKSNIIKYN